MFTYDSILGWAISGERIVRDGPLRAASFVERLTAGELEAQASLVREGGGGDEALRRRAVQLGALVFTVSLAVSFAGEHLQLGINLLTAELLLACAAATMLLRTIRRLA
jgi:hypothetical protein